MKDSPLVGSVKPIIINIVVVFSGAVGTEETKYLVLFDLQVQIIYDRNMVVSLG